MLEAVLWRVLLNDTMTSIFLFIFFGLLYLNQMVEMAQSVWVKLGTPLNKIVTQNVLNRLVEKSVKGLIPTHNSSIKSEGNDRWKPLMYKRLNLHF